jgi:hypothetical protein
MFKAIIIGDVHCEWDLANQTVNSALAEHPDVTCVIQVGDLGDGWPTRNGPSRWHPDFDLPVIWIDGNHENFDMLQGERNPELTYMPRGTAVYMDRFDPLKRQIMFFGGATSPDTEGRTIGVNWWPQESITRDQVLSTILNPYLFDKDVHALFCHERPHMFEIPSNWRLFEDRIGEADRIGLAMIVEKFKPKFVFHGHWHKGHDEIYNGVRVVCCPVIDTGRKWTVWDGNQIWRNW